MIKKKLADTLDISKELFKYSVKNDDEYLQDNLMKIIVNLSTLLEEKVESRKIKNDLTEEDEIQKVFRKVPRWIKNPSQYNSKILDTYMSLSNNNKNPVELVLLEAGSGLKERKFLTNYTQMKIIAEKNHAKVFTEKNDMVYLWEPVSEFIEDVYEGKDIYLFDQISAHRKRINSVDK